MIQEVMLVSGQHVVGRVAGSIMSMPHTIELIPHQGGMAPTFIPFGSHYNLLPAVESFTLDPHKLMYPPRDVSPAVAQQYIKVTSGIEIASALPGNVSPIVRA